MVGRRLLILVAVLMGLTALAASLAPQPPTGRQPGATATPAPTLAPTTVAIPAPVDSDPGVVARRVDARRGHAPVRIELRTGQRLELTVRVAAPDAVALDALDLEPADPQSPATLRLFADAPGSYPLRLVSTGRRLGVVHVSG